MMDDHQFGLVANLLAYCVQRDIPLERLCALSGVNSTRLMPPATAVLSASQLNELWVNASRLSHDELFGLHFGESLQVAALGLVGQLIQTSPTVGQALVHAAQQLHRLTNVFAMSLTKTDHSFVVQLVPDGERVAQYPVMARHLMDLAMVLVIQEVDGFVLAKIKPRTVTLPYLVTHRPEYERLLRCAVIDQAEAYALTFEARYWDLPILTANYEWQTLLVQQTTSLGDPFGPRKSMTERVTNQLITQAYLGIPTLAELAANFNTSSRSLQRKLQEEGSTYQQVADSIRKSLATTYLDSGKHPLKEISYLLGYNELSAFNRAFKRWTGTTPGQYRKG